MNYSFRNWVLVFLLLLNASLTFPQDSIKINYRRTDNRPLDNYNPSDKETFFPIGTVATGTGVWTELNPKVPRVDYLGIHFINKDTGWAVGAYGALIRTTDGAVSWTVTSTNISNPLLKVTSFGNQVILASGFDGVILRSSNCGQNWTQVSTPVPGDLWGLFAIDDTLGWACGNSNSLMKTTNAGLTWQRVFTPGYTSDYWWIDFLDKSYGFIAANGYILKTIDAGNNWEIIQAVDAYPLFTLDIIDSLHIAAAGYGGMGYPTKNIFSTDGGNTWLSGSTAALSTHEANCIRYINSSLFMSVSEMGIYKTTNYGQEWTGVTGQVGEVEFYFLPGNIGYSAGTGLKLFKTTGNYENWQRLIINDELSDICFTDENKGYMISPPSAGKFYRTFDGGLHWENHGPSGTSVMFIDSVTGFISNPAYIWKTTDAGEIWYITEGSIGANKIGFFNNQIGWALRANKIFKTIDGGENWFQQDSLGVSVYFENLAILDSVTVWTANANRRPFKTTDGGLNWVQQTNLNIYQSIDVKFNNNQIGFFLEDFKVYKSVDGGLSFNVILNTNGVINRFSNSVDSIFFVCGNRSYRTVNNGQSWEVVDVLYGKKINGIYLINGGLGYAAGTMGLLYKYYDSTYLPVELINFTCSLNSNKVSLDWITSSELNNSGFIVQRREKENADWESIGFVPGSGTTTLTQSYSYADYLQNNGVYYYRLKQIDYDGTAEYSGTVEINFSNIEYYVSQNYPNPFNSSTKIDFYLPEGTDVSITVIDVLGSTVVYENSKTFGQGWHSYKLSSDKLSSGTYFYRFMTRSGLTSINKLIIIK